MEQITAGIGRVPRILWANPYCLMDTSSGASITAREMLRQLKLRGAEVKLFGASVFDNPNGRRKVLGKWDEIISNTGKIVQFEDGVLTHNVLVTRSTDRAQMTASEEATWYAYYTNQLDTFKPDLVMFYGGQPLDYLIPDAAKERGIPSASYLVNSNYAGDRWCRDVNLILTDSFATANKYAQEQNYLINPVGTFIDRQSVVSAEREPQNVLFINPSVAKGAGIVIQLALLLEKSHPDIAIEVVESRGDWHKIVSNVTAALGEQRESLPNVIVTPNTADMRPIYRRAKLLLAPSLCWDSGPRVIAEAVMNGVPVITVNRGGCPEMMGRGGITLSLPEECHEAPYIHLPQMDKINALMEFVVRLYQDNAKYEELSQLALASADQIHNIEANTQRLITAIAPLLSLKAGDRAGKSSGNYSSVVMNKPSSSEAAAGVDQNAIVSKLLPFAPNTAGWTGGQEGLLDITLESATTFLAPLSCLFERRTKQGEFPVRDINELSKNRAASKIANALGENFDRQGSDKNTVHNYTLLYADILSRRLQKHAYHLMEIGLGTNNVDVPSNMASKGRPGASLRAFRDFDERINVVGADFDKRILFEEERIKTYYINQRDPATFEEFKAKIGLQFDLIIDDGLHAVHANLNSVQHLLPLVKPNGSMVVEDIMESMLPVWQLALKAFDPNNFACTIWKGKAAFAVQIQKLKP